MDFLASQIIPLFDRDGDGKISVGDFCGFYRAYRIEDTDVLGVFRRLDLDGSGQLSRDALIELGRQFYVSEDPASPGNWLFGPF